MEYAKDGYEKRPTWRKIIAYLLIGGLAYIAVYYAFSKNKSVYAPETAPSALTTDNFTVTYGPNGFEPQNLTIKAGDTVIWTNQGEAKMDVASSPHPAHTDYPALNLGLANTNESKSLSFPKLGTYKYHNHLNAGHYGLITVE